jgi:hypothetical protein
MCVHVCVCVNVLHERCVYVYVYDAFWGVCWRFGNGC